jgi:hypothetical protein
VSLAGLDAWTLAAARDGLEHGAGPFWDASQLCGRPLFGVWGQPWSSPLALLLMSAGAWPLLALAALGAVFLWREGPRRRWTLAAALLGVAGFSSMPAGFVAGLALAPWALLAFWRAPRPAAIGVLALFLSVLSPLLSVAVLGLAYFERRLPGDWAQRVGWALLLIVPAVLPLFSHSTAVLELGRAWPLAAPSEWLAALAWSCSVSLLGAPKRWMPLAVTGAAALTGMLLLSVPPAAASSRSATLTLRYNEAYSRYLDSSGDPSALAQAAAGLLPQARMVGSLDGRGSLLGLRRWKRLSLLGVHEPDLLSLSNVGWLGGMQEGQGQRWTLPVSLAMVDGAVLEGDQEARWSGLSLFQRPLKVLGVAVPSARGTVWHLLTPEALQQGSSQVTLPGGHAAAWLFFSESYDPGWQALVRDPQGRWTRHAPVRAEGGFMALPVETAAQAVLFQFRPPFFTGALALSLLALGALVWKERVFGRQTR